MAWFLIYMEAAAACSSVMGEEEMFRFLEEKLHRTQVPRYRVGTNPGLWRWLFSGELNSCSWAMPSMSIWSESTQKNPIYLVLCNSPLSCCSPWAWAHLGKGTISTIFLFCLHKQGFLALLFFLSFGFSFFFFPFFFIPWQPSWNHRSI